MVAVVPCRWAKAREREGKYAVPITEMEASW